jgi:RNA polymerase sigma-70 factor (ECF subfamily)
MPSAFLIRAAEDTSGPAAPSCSAEGRHREEPTVGRTFDSVYHAHASFVWRSTCRLGVPYSAVEDVMQEVFLVVHRRLAEFEERTSVRAWLSAIVIRVVRAYRRKVRRRDPRQEHAASPTDPDSIVDPKGTNPLESMERDEAVKELYEILALMNDERREVFVLSELEDLSAPEIAHATQVNVNTVYWRLRMAKKEFGQILLRRRALETRSPR